MVTGKLIFFVVAAIVLFFLLCVKVEKPEKQIEVLEEIIETEAKLIAKLTEEENRFVAEFKIGEVTVNAICVVEKKKVKVGDVIKIVYSKNYIYQLPTVFLQEEFHRESN